jgi:serine/threonine protein kinase
VFAGHIRNGDWDKELNKVVNDADHVSAMHYEPNFVGERYQVLEVIGKGGMGTVLKGRHIALNKMVAIKVLNSALLAHDVSRKRFEIEAQAGSKLSHPNLISVFDYGFTKLDEPYLVMEYVDGDSIDRLLLKHGTLNIKELLDVFIQVCKALQYVHSSGVIHRDLKTSNIMIQAIGAERYAKLLDFGIAKVFNDCGETPQHLTETGIPYGSPLYMSPEQCQGQKVDSRSDIYSFGCVMYECFTGQPPLKGENPLQTIFKQVSETPRPLACNNQPESEFSLLVQKCLEKEPGQRFQSAADLLATLNAIAMTLHRAGLEPLSQSSQSNRPQFRQNTDLKRSQKDQLKQSPTTESQTSAHDRSESQSANWDYVGMAKKATVMVIALAVVSYFAVGLITVLSVAPHVWQLKLDADKAFETTHLKLQKYNQDLSRENRGP